MRAYLLDRWRPLLSALLSFVSLQALGDIPLLGIDSVWRYHQDTSLDGIPWTAPGYNDAGWPAGPALFFVETNPLVGPRNTALAPGGTTYYFRTRFDFPYPAPGVVLRFQSKIDDGAVFYLDGQELFRVRMPAAPAVITSTNLATYSPGGGDAVLYDYAVLPGRALSAGEHVLAVEVHQGRPPNDDIVFGAIVTAQLANSPPIIVRQPSDLTVLDAHPATLSVAVEGNPTPTLQWFKDGMTLLHQTNATLALGAAAPQDAGTYWLTASNSLGTLTSSNAVLTVLADLEAPAVLAAVAAPDLTNITVTFSEAVTPATAGDAANYGLFRPAVPAEQLEILSVILESDSRVTLRTAPRRPGLNYTLRVAGIRDGSAHGNPIEPGTEVALRYAVELLRADEATRWRHFETAPGPGSDWMLPGFDPAAWAEDPAVFAAGSPAPSEVDPVRTTLPLPAGTNAIMTYYFRTRIDLAGPVESNSLRLRVLVDDGAVFYLNGREAFSVGMPPTRPVSPTTAATRSVGTAVYEPPLVQTGFALAESLMVPGENHLAVEVHQNAAGLEDLAFAARLEAVLSYFAPRPQFSIPAEISEGAGPLAGEVFIAEPLSTNLVLELSSSEPSILEVPASVTIAAGSTNAGFNLAPVNDTLLNGARRVVLRAGQPALPTASAPLEILDDESNSIEVEVAPSLAENQGVVEAELRLARAPDVPLTATLTSSDPASLRVPAQVALPAGATRVPLALELVDNPWLDGPRSVTLTVSVRSWPDDATTVTVSDNETAHLALELPVSVVESAGTLTNRGRVVLGGLVRTDVIARLTLVGAAGSGLSLPATVVIPAGRGDATFDVSIGDDREPEANREVTIIAEADSFLAATNLLAVLDDDPHHIRFGPIPGWVDTATGFGIALRAEHADGALQTNFHLSLTLVAEAMGGSLTVDPVNTGPFAGGERTAWIQVSTAGRMARLRTLEYPGQSDAFNVVLPPFYAIDQPVADVAWHAASQTLLASVPATSATYSNCLVAIDPVTGQITNAYPLATGPWRIELAPGGNDLFIAVSNDVALQRFDVSTRTAGAAFALGGNAQSQRVAYDFCVPSGLTNTVVVAARDRSWSGEQLAGFWRYTAGQPTELTAFNANGGWLVESMPTGADVLLFPPWARGNAASGAILAANPAYGSTQATVRDGHIFDEKGNDYAASSLSWLGAYPDVLAQIPSYETSLVEVNPDLRRVYYLAGHFNYGQAFYRLKIYDRDLRIPLFSLRIPGNAGWPARFLRCGTNAMVYTTSNGRLWFIRPDFVQPTDPPAELGVALGAVPAVAQVRKDYTFQVVLTNAGPGIASLARLTNAFPADTTLVRTVAATGQVAATASGFTWTVTALPAGSSATLEVTLLFNEAGARTNRLWVQPFEHDPQFVNNTIALPLNVELPPASPGVFALSQPAEDMLYDATRDRLILSVAQGEAGRSNGLALLNPANGQVESFTALGAQPGALAQSHDRQQLYVSLPQEAVVRRLTLANLQQNAQFGLGGEFIYDVWYPFYAADLAVVPGAAESIVAWRMRRPGPMADAYPQGLALFDNGVQRSNTTPAGGSWAWQFDSDRSVLYAQALGGYPARPLHRCTLNADGVTLPALCGSVRYTVGTDFKFASGRFFFGGGVAGRPDPFEVTALYPGSERSALVEPDAATGRVYFLTVAGSDAVLTAHDMESTALLGRVSITNVVGSPLDLLRCGAHGLVFRTTSGRLYFVRTPLIAPALDADLALDLALSSTAPALDEVVTGTLTLANGGPGLAPGVTVTASIPEPATLLSSTCETGACTSNAAGVRWTIPPLAAGESTTLTFTLVGRRPGVVTLVAGCTAEAIDPVPSNNTVLAALRVGAWAAFEPVVLPLSALDVVWSSTLGKLLFTASTNLPHGDGFLGSLDPVTFELRQEARLAPGAGRLCLSVDGTRLFAAPAYGIESLRLPGFTPDRRFLLGNQGAWELVEDLEPLPGQADALAVLRRTESAWAEVVVYDGGIARTNVGTSTGGPRGEVMTLGSNATQIYVQNLGVGGLERYGLDAQGVTNIDANATLLPTSTPMDLVAGGPHLFSSLGMVVDPENQRRVGVIPGIPEDSAVCFDEASARIFFLSGSSNGATLRAFDGPTLLPVGALEVPGSTGTVTRLVRWGPDGFAFLTRQELVVLRSRLVPTQPPADLAVGLAQSVDGDVTATCTIANLGPNVAAGVTWTNDLPAGCTVLQAEASHGSAVVTSNLVTGSIPALEVNAVATIRVVFQSPGAGVKTNLFATLADSADPNFANNQAAALLWIQEPAGGTGWQTLDLPVKDLARHPLLPLLYASCGSDAGALADSIVIIDPINGTLSSPIRVGSDPGRLVASPDGKVLYVGLDGSGLVQRLKLPGLLPAGSFAVPNHETVLNMAVSPLNSDMVVLFRTPSRKASLHVGGAARPQELAHLNLFAFAQNSGELFGGDGRYSGLSLLQLDTGPAGLAPLGEQPGHQSSTEQLLPSGDWLFYNRGMVVDPHTQRVQAMLPVPYDALVEPDADSGRAFFLTRQGVAWTLRAYDFRQGIEVGSVPLPTSSGTPRRLLRFGVDGFAVCMDSRRILVLRSALVPTGAPVEVSLRQSVEVTAVAAQTPFRATLTLTNGGSTLARGVEVSQTFSLPVAQVTLATAAGEARLTNGAVTWRVGDLPAQATATLEVNLQANQTGTLNLAARATHAHNDLFWGNNVALNAVKIAPAPNLVPLQIRFPAQDLIYDASRNLLYASTPASQGLPGNIVAALNPETGALERTLPAGSEPNRLALSDDARFLYVGVNGAVGVRRFDLNTGAVDLEFPLSTNDLCFAQELAVQPGHPPILATSLGSFNLAAGWPSDVVLYDAGVPRPVSARHGRSLAFAEDGSWLFGQVIQGVMNLHRLRLGPDGFDRIEPADVFTRAPGELKMANGRLYSAAGEVVDPFLAAPLGAFSFSGQIAVDAAVGRVFFLAKPSSQWELRAYDAATFQAVGTQVVAGVEGTALNLVRCGADRLAFRTSSNQIVVVKSPLVSTQTLELADLVVSQEAAQDFEAPTETIRYHLAVTNRGPGIAHDVILAVRPPAGRATMAVQLSQGTLAETATHVLGRIGTLQAGQAAQAILEITIANSGPYATSARVTAIEPDPNLSDNQAQAEVMGLRFQPANSMVVTAHRPRALAYDPNGRRLFALVRTETDGSRLVWIDPESSAELGSSQLPIPADRLAITDDATFLYVADSGSGRIARLALPELTVDLLFATPDGTIIQGLGTIPGRPRALALCYGFYPEWLVGLCFDGHVLPTQVSGLRFVHFAGSDGDDTLFGYSNMSTGGDSPDLFRLAIEPAGLRLIDTGPSDQPWANGREMRWWDGQLFFENGAVMKPDGWSLEAPFPLPDQGHTLTVLPEAGLVAFLVSEYSNPRLIVSAIEGRRQLSDTIHVPGNSGFANLTWCGADRFAFHNTEKLVLVRAPGVPAADLALRIVASAPQVSPSTPITLTFVTSNTGPFDLSGAWLTNTIPAALDLLAFTNRHGTVRVEGRNVIADLGQIRAGAAAEMTLTLVAHGQAWGRVNNTAVVAGPLPDPILFNNRATRSLQIVGEDRDLDLMPDVWELAHDLDPDNPSDAAEDPDGDGRTNLAEFRDRTDPRRADTPSNDRFADATVIPAETSAWEVSGSAAGAGWESAEPAHGGAASAARSVWWTWTPLYDGPVVVAQPDPEAGCWMSVYTGETLGALVPVGQGATPGGTLTFTATAGTRYSLACDAGVDRPGAYAWMLRQWTLGLSLPPGSTNPSVGRATTLSLTNLTAGFALREARLLADDRVVSTLAAPFQQATWTAEQAGWTTLSIHGVDEAGHDRWSESVPLLVGSGNDAWADAQVLPAEPSLIAFDGVNGHATAEPGEPAHGGQAAARSLWWSWTPAYAGTASLSVSNRGDGVVRLAIYTGETLTNLQTVAAQMGFANEPGLALRCHVQAGEHYWIALDGAFSDPAGAFSATLEWRSLVIVHPASGSKLALSQPATLVVTNTDPRFQPQEVELFLDGVSLGLRTSPLYQWEWAASSGGWHELQARATGPDNEVRWSWVQPVRVAPANDDWARALVLPGDGQAWTVAGDTAFASWEPGEPDAHPDAGHGSVWYRWEPPRTREFSLRFTGPPGTRLQGFTGASLDHLTPTFPSVEGETTLSALFEAGTPHYFRVNRHESAATPRAFNLSLIAPPPNDDLANAIAVTGQTGVIEASNFSASSEPGEPLLDLMGSLWWRWTAPETGEFRLWADSSECFVVAAMHSGTSYADLSLLTGPVRLLAHSPWAASPLVRRVRQGQSYLIQLGSDPRGGPPAGLLRVVYELEPMPNLPANDNYADRTRLLGANVSDSGVHTLATWESWEPADTGSQTLWWEWTAATNGAARIWAEGVDITPVLMLYTWTAPWGLIEAYPRLDRLNFSGLSGPFTLPVLAGSIYQISVGVGHWQAGANGSSTLHIENWTLNPAATNDAFASAVLLPEGDQQTSIHFAGSSFEPQEPDPTAGLPPIPTYSGSLWWRLQPTRAARLVVEASHGTAFPLVTIYRGSSLPDLQRLNVGTGLASVEVAPGEVYYVALVGSSHLNDAGTLTCRYLPLAASNDVFASSIRIAGTNAAFSGALYGCTREPGEPAHALSGDPPDGRTIWWSWVAPFSGRAALAYDTRYLVAGVYTGPAVDRLTRVDVTGQAFYAIQDTLYRFGIEGYPGAPDSVALNLSLVALPTVPRNDNFADAIPLFGRQTGTTEPNLGATREPGEPAHRPGGPNKSLWWRWTAPHHASVVVQNLTGITRGVTLAVYTGSTLDNLSLIASGTDLAQFYATGGTTYQIAAETAADQDGDIGVQVQQLGSQAISIPVPGNLLLNPSFEELEAGWPTAHWEVSGNVAGVVGQGHPEGAADGTNFLVLGGAQIAQTVPTVPGAFYRIKLAMAGTDYYGPVRVVVRFGTASPVEYGFEATSAERYYHWPEFVCQASAELTRLEIETIAASVNLDQVSVVAAHQAPRVTRQPESRTAFAGSTVSFHVEIEGDEPLRLQWLFNGSPLEGERSLALVLTNLSAAHVGTYQCRATNAFGTILTDSATLGILTPTSPILMLHPQDANPRAGDYVTLVTLALGTPPLHLQWFRDGQPLPGETNRTLILPEFQPNQAGRYHVLVSNLAESVTSLMATVTEAPTVPNPAIIQFRNQRLPGTLFSDAPIFDVDGITPLGGDTFRAQLYVGASADALWPVSHPRGFYAGIREGLIQSESVTLRATPAGTAVQAQIRVWQAVDGLSYEEARALGGKTGESAVLTVATDSAFPPSPASGLLLGLTSFSLHAGLPEFQGGILTVLGRDPDGRISWSLLGQPGARYLVERKIDGANWLPLVTLENVTGQVIFNDRPQADPTAVFYRAMWLP